VHSAGLRWWLLEIDQRLSVQDAIAERLQPLLPCQCLQRGGDIEAGTAQPARAPCRPLTPSTLIYLFSLAFGLIFPLPLDVGVAEISGVGAFLAIGVDKSAAVGTMLVMRTVSIGVGLVVALIAILVLNDEFRAALRERPPAPGSRPSPAIRRTRAPGQADEVVRAGTARERDAAEDAES
jgi:hypothetical protein